MPTGTPEGGTLDCDHCFEVASLKRTESTESARLVSDVRALVDPSSMRKAGRGAGQKHTAFRRRPARSPHAHGRSAARGGGQVTFGPSEVDVGQEYTYSALKS